MSASKFQHIRHPHPYKQAADLDHFWVITVISNTSMYKRRYELYWPFIEMCHDAGVNVITVEHVLGERPFAVTEPGNPYHVQIRSVEELWLKENMVDLGVHRAKQLDVRAREVAWVDADCQPATDSARAWFELTWHMLQRYQFVQMWQYLQNYGPQNQPVDGQQLSFMKTYEKMGFRVPASRNIKWDDGHSGFLTLGRPGLAWAANVDALDAVGGMLDFCILGSGDWHMAHGLVGAMKQGSSEFDRAAGAHPYRDALFEWQERCTRWIKRDVGYVPVSLTHSWHGNKADRKYPTRGKILGEHKYDPRTDIKYDAFGQLHLETWDDRQISLRDQIRWYMQCRNEDSVDIIK